MVGEIALFGAGKIGKAALNILKREDQNVRCFLDNDSRKWGKNIMGVPVMGVDEFLQSGVSPVTLTCSVRHRNSIIKQLQEAGIGDIEVFDERKLWAGLEKESIVSYSHESDLEDVALYHILKHVCNVFYIDVGSNDPWLNSVTKLMYNGGGTVSM